MGGTVEYVAAAAPGYQFVRWQSDNAAGTAVICGLSSPPATSSTYAASSTCRFAINDNLQTQAVFADTTNPAMAALSGPTGAVSGPASFSFSAAADPTLKSYECRVAGFRDAWTACVSGVEESPPDGTWVFEVRAVDFSNRRSAPSTWEWSVDTVAPETSILTGPPAATTATSAAIEFGSSELPGGFRCQLDSGDPAPCSSPYTASALAVGAHTLKVWASDGVGNEDATPAEVGWTVNAPAAPEPDPPPEPAPPSGTPPGAAPPGPTRSLARVRAITLGAGVLKLSKGAISLSVFCPSGQACSGSVAVAAAKPRLALGKGAYWLAAGKRATLRVKLSAKGLRLLQRLGKLRVKISTTTRDAAGRQAKAAWTRTLRL